MDDLRLHAKAKITRQKRDFKASAARELTEAEERRFAMWVKDAEDEADLDYTEKLAVYKQQISKRNNAVASLAKYDAQLKVMNIYAAYLDGATNLVFTMTSKLTEALNKVSTFRNNCMNSQVVLASGATISNPYQSGSFAGMYRVLEKRFNMPHLVSFMHCWLDAFGARTTSPSKSIDEVLTVVSKFSATMNDRNMWDLVTKDTLSIIIVILGLDPKSEIREKVVVKAIELMNEHYAEKINGISSGNNVKPSGHSLVIHTEHSTPIFHKLETYMREILQRTSQLKVTSGELKGDSRGGGGGGRGNRDLNTSQAAFAETANAAQDTRGTGRPQGGAAVASNKAPTIPANVINPKNGRLFDNPVPRSDNKQVWHPVKNVAYKYAAQPTLHDLCDKCWDDQKRLLPGHCKPICFHSQCTICNYLGHSKDSCVQKRTKDGAPITSA